MCPRIVVACVLMVVVLISRGGAAATVEERIAALEKRAADLQTRVKAHDDDIERLTTTVETFGATVEKLAAESKKAAAKPAATEAKIQSLQEEVRTLSQGMRVLKSDSHELIAELQQNLRTQQDILAAISENDGSGRPILALRNTMNSRQGRQQLGQAINDTLLRQGTLRVRNAMLQTEPIWINGRRYNIPADGRYHRISVPVGTVTTELVGWEAPRNWTISPPTYEQTIDIVPQQEPQVVEPEPSLAGYVWP